MSRLDYAFYVDGVDERVRWDIEAREIWSDLYSCALWDHWSEYNHRIHDFDDYGDVHPLDLEFLSCTYCGVYGENVERDLEHVLPRKYFPELAFDRGNIVISCKPCNKEKGNKVGKPVGQLILPYQKRLAEKKGKQLLDVCW